METEDKLDLEVFVCTNLPQTPQEITALAIHSLSMPAANHIFQHLLPLLPGNTCFILFLGMESYIGDNISVNREIPLLAN